VAGGAVARAARRGARPRALGAALRGADRARRKRASSRSPPARLFGGGGVALGLLNHLTTEFWLLRIITSGEQPTRNKLAASTLLRLLVLSVVAVGIAVWFWPDGIGLLFGLAIFRLIALVMTTVPLLKELKNP